MSFFKFTKQGVRDLNSLPAPEKTKKDVAAWQCDHRRIRECHPGCGHFSCICGIVWDHGYEGRFPFEGF